MPLSSSVEVIENFQISPPLNSVPTTSIPLTFFDIPWFISPPIQRVLFYEFRHPTLHFTQNVLPKLNHSLSLTLQHYFPLAGTAVYPQQEHTKPYILYEDGESSVPLIIVESKFNNFDRLVKNYPKDVREFHPLVPELQLQPPLSSIETYTQVRVQLLHPLIAFQVTIFPNKGICIGYAYRHVVGDGRVINNFVKSWASIFKSDDCHLSTVLLPLHDREDLIKDPYDHLLNTTWKQWIELQFSSQAPLAAAPYGGKLRATFVIGRQDINKLKVWIESQIVNNNNNEAPPQPSPLHVSTFVVTCAFIWVCLIKTKNNVVTTTSDNTVSTSDNDVLYHFMFAADCTNRKDFRVPKNYFGNCFRPCFATVKRSEILCENGLIVTAKAIMKEVKELNNGLLEGAEGWFPNVMKISGSGNVLKVAGSPKFRIYETDFGWGMPKKSEIVHINRSGWISLADCRDDEEDGIEVGLALNKVEMETFISIFELGLQNLC